MFLHSRLLYTSKFYVCFYMICKWMYAKATRSRQRFWAKERVGVPCKQGEQNRKFGFQLQVVTAVFTLGSLLDPGPLGLMHP